MSLEIIKKLGPLAALAGTWEGEKGIDVAPSPLKKIETTKYRELITFVPMGPINNHEQELYGLRYSTTAFKVGAVDAFHEELGYWLWDAKDEQVIRCFMVPRGVTILAGGTVKSDAKEFRLSAKVGSEIYGICCNKFLNREFKTVEYKLKVSIHDEKSFSYEEDTILKINGQSDLFHHTDKNTLTKRVP